MKRHRVRGRAAARRQQPWSVWCFTLVLAGAAAAAWPEVAARGHPALPEHHIQLPWLVLTAGFVAGQLATQRFEIAGESHATSLSEVPLLIGLVFVGGGHLLLATVLGSAVGVVLKHQRPLKAAFNITIRAVETMVAATCFHLILGTHAVASAHGWLAAFAAVATANLVSAACVQAVIALSVGGGTRPVLRLLVPVHASLTVLNVAVGWVAVTLLLNGDTAAALIFLAIPITLGYGYRAYGGLRRRHVDLEQIYHFSGEVSRMTDATAVIGAVLVEAKRVARSSVAELSLSEPDGTATYTLGADGSVRCTRGSADHPLQAVTTAAGGGILALRRRNEPPVVQALAGAGLRDAVAATVVSGEDCLGILVAGDRLGEQLSFEVGDREVIRALASHTAMALRSIRLHALLVDEVAEKDYQALHDALTGLANRTLFNERVEAMLAGRDRVALVAVMVMDLDRFKEVNDTLGHHTGDVMLQQIAAQLVEAVAGRGLVARLGGDEFAFVFSAASRAEVAAVADEVLAAGQATVLVEGLHLEMRASLGVAIAPDHGGDRSTLLRRADVAMYHAKTVGSGTEVYQPQRDPHTTRRLVLASELRLALESSALELHYQPKAEILTGRVSGVEALLRWTHPVYGTVGPDEFIPLAEQSGLIRPLTRWALETGVRQLAVWRREGFDLTLAVNLSARSVFDAELAEDLARLLAGSAIPAGSLTLEITESSIFGDRPAGHTALDHLAQLGVRLAIDDFGTGYSSLSRLARLPVHEVKIDKSFVTTMLTNDGHDAIVRSTIDLARNLHLRVVAEGVEDQATWWRLGRLGCDAGQGYHLSPPLRASEFARWLWLYQRRQVDSIRALEPVGGARRA